jgi:hypothetical protein
MSENMEVQGQGMPGRVLEWTMSERVAILDALPQAGSYHDVATAFDIECKLAIGQEEATACNMKRVVQEGRPVAFQFDGAKASPVEKDMTPAELRMLRQILKGMSDHGRLRRELMNKFEEIVLTDMEIVGEEGAADGEQA